MFSTNNSANTVNPDREFWFSGLAVLSAMSKAKRLDKASLEVSTNFLQDLNHHAYRFLMAKEILSAKKGFFNSLKRLFSSSYATLSEEKESQLEQMYEKSSSLQYILTNISFEKGGRFLSVKDKSIINEHIEDLTAVANSIFDIKVEPN